MSGATKVTASSARTSENAGRGGVGIQVIGAGLGRTGTMSLSKALEILGYNKPYHYIDFAHAPQWAALARDEKETDVDAIVDLIAQDGYTAVVENPCSDIYQEILARYPEAKVILTVRDSPEKFETSWKILMDTMVVTERKFSWTFPSFFGFIPLFRQLRDIRKYMGTTHLGLENGALTHGWRQKEEGWLGEQYTRHNQHVQNHVPKEQLLVFNVKEGWKPLCEFLGCDIPQDDIPFPHVKTNDSKALIQLRRTFLIAIYSWIPVLLSIGTTATVACFWRSSQGQAPSRLTLSKRSEL